MEEQYSELHSQRIEWQRRLLIAILYGDKKEEKNLRILLEHYKTEGYEKWCKAHGLAV